MRLLEIYEDLFQYVCMLNRASKAQAQPEFERVRTDIKEKLAQTRRDASSDVRLLKQVEYLYEPMVFFVDNVICTSRLKFATQWATNRLAAERNQLAGDERFFTDFLQPDLGKTDDEAKERLAVYYMCLCLGFTGMYVGQPEEISRRIEQIYPRVAEYMDRDKKRKISEEAYNYTNTTVLTEPPSKKIILVAMLFIFFTLSSLCVYYGLFVKASEDLKESVNKIISQSAEGAKP